MFQDYTVSVEIDVVNLLKQSNCNLGSPFQLYLTYGRYGIRHWLASVTSFFSEHLYLNLLIMFRCDEKNSRACRFNPWFLAQFFFCFWARKWWVILVQVVFKCCVTGVLFVLEEYNPTKMVGFFSSFFLLQLKFAIRLLYISTCILWFMWDFLLPKLDFLVCSSEQIPIRNCPAQPWTSWSHSIFYCTSSLWF